MKDLSQYRVLAGLFDYPDASYKDKIIVARKYLLKASPEAHAECDVFARLLLTMSVKDMQELFTRSFDVQSITTLDIGYVLFGEDYKRGEILSNLNREHKKYNNDCGFELADHLPNILRLLPKLEDEVLVEELVSDILGPALEKMIEGFDPERLKKKDKTDKKNYKTVIERVSPESILIYKSALQALLIVLKSDFTWKAKPLPLQTIDFLKSVNQEIQIEDSV